MATAVVTFRDPATGATLVSLATRMTKILGQFSTGTSPGSVTIPELGSVAGAQGFFTTLPGFGNAGKDSPSIVLSGSTLSWSWKYAGDPAGRSPAQVLYGFYTGGAL